jgi:hypothetical protein
VPMASMAPATLATACVAKVFPEAAWLARALQKQQRELKSLRAANAALNARLRAIENVIAKSSATERPQP